MQGVAALYRFDIIKDGIRWADPVGLRVTADTIAATAVGLVAEAAAESRPGPGLCCCAEVIDEDDNFVLRAEIRISDHKFRDLSGLQSAIALADPPAVTSGALTGAATVGIR